MGSILQDTQIIDLLISVTMVIERLLRLMYGFSAFVVNNYFAMSRFHIV